MTISSHPGRNTHGVTTSAARLEEWLLTAIDRADDGRSRIADVWRAVAVAAEREGRTRPSYERVRTGVHERRERSSTSSTGDVLLDVAFRVRSPEAILDHIAGTRVR